MVNVSSESKPRFVPTNPKGKLQVEAVQNLVQQSSLLSSDKMIFTTDPYKIYTSVCVFMEAIRRTMRKNNKQYISIGDVITIEKTNRVIDSSEKVGSINAKVSLGEIGKKIVESGVSGFTDVLADNSDIRSDMAYTQAVAIKDLYSDYKIGFNAESFELYHIVIIFFIYCIIVTVENASNEEVDEDEFEIPIGEGVGGYFRFKFKRTNDGGFDICLPRGAALKVDVKSDATTER